MLSVKTISLDTNYGSMQLCILDILKKKNISMYRLSILTGIKYDIIYNYCNNKMQRYDKDVLAKICYVLDCKYSDLISYIPNKDDWFIRK